VSDEQATKRPVTAALKPVVIRKATDLIAEQIRQRIFSGEYRTGDVLPSEAELVVQTASSGSSVRGALRILETQGLIHMKQGRSGGAIVKVPGQDELETTMSQLIRGQDISLTELLGMQDAIEPLCARLAAESRTEADLEAILAALEPIVHHQGDIPSLLEAHSVWHVAVSQASHNQLLSGLMIALVRWIHVATQGANAIAGKPTSAPYERITRAIQNQDADDAFLQMKEHIARRADVMTRVMRTNARE
jgi:GntR family transcriptional repressor for pyruvate dehydrogenase complex